MHTALLLQKISECTISSLHHQQTQSIGTDAKKEKKTDTNRLNIGQSPRKPPDSLVVKIPSNREQTVAPSKHMIPLIHRE
jgi:hypothetical protein